MTGRRSGDPRETPIQAALTQESATGPREHLRRRMGTAPWMEKVKDYDLNGPGVAGYYLDTVALMASLCPMYVSVRNKSGEYERSDDPILQVALDGYRGALMSQADLVFAAVRGRESLGRVWHIRDTETGYNVVPAARIVDPQRMGWTDLYGRQRISPIEQTWRSWYPDPYSPWEPTSPMRRSLPDLRRLRSFARNQTRSADSRMTTNGILAFPTDPLQAGSRPYDGMDPSGAAGGLSGTSKTMDDFIELSKLAHTDDESPASMVPFPMEGVAPQFVDLGRMIDPTALEGERMAIEGFARAVNFPQQLLTMGPGASNHWNEFLVQETAVKMSLAPKLQPVCDDVLVFHLRPMIERFRNQLTEWRRSVDPRHVKVEFDLSFLLRRPKQVNEMIQAYMYGIATRQQVADELGIVGEILSIPNGLSEYEHWELATNGKGAPYAEVDREGNLIVPPPPDAMGAMPGADPAALPPGAPGAPGADIGAAVSEALGGGAGAPPSGGDGTVTEPAPPPAMTAALPMLALPRWSAEKARSVREMKAAAESPPDGESDQGAVVGTSVTAALETDPEVETTRKLWADAATADRVVSAELAGLLSAISTAVQVEVAKRVITAHPARSEVRQRLASLPVEQVWANADPEVKKNFPVEQVVAETVERYRPQVQAAYEEAAQGFLQRWGGVIAAVLVVSALGRATDALLAGFRGWAVGRYVPEVRLSAGGRGTPRRSGERAVAGVVGRPVPIPEEPGGRGMVTSSGEPAVPPTMIVRDSMLVAGGARQDRNELPVRDGGGNPTPERGGPWRGGTGWLTGHNVVAASPRPPIRWRWHHGFIRQPKVPYRPHLELDGQVFDRPSDVPGGFFPNDHKHCGCALLPII